MNKKATRLSSIALAFMMVFAIAVALFPVASASAAGSAEVDIIVDESGATDSKNLIVLDDKTYTLKVSKVLWADSIDKEVDSVRMILRDWEDKTVPGYNDVIMQASNTEEGIYTKSFDALKAVYKSTVPGQTGLYTMELWRNFKDGTRDQTSIKVGAFWLAEEDAVKKAEWDEKTGASTKAKLNATNSKIYVGPEAKIEYSEGTATLVAGDEFRAVNPVTKNGFVAKLTAPGDTKTYTLPKDIAHKTEMVFKGILIEPAAATRKCTIVEVQNKTHAAATARHKAEMDSEGPETGEIVISGNNYIPTVYDGIMFANPAATVGATYVETEKLVDDGIGVAGGAISYLKFTNILAAGHTHGSSTATPLAAAVNNYFDAVKNPDSAAYTMALTAADAALVDSQWYLDVIAVDDLGNETVRRYGKVNVIETYVPVDDPNGIRVESQNVIEMYVGQKLTFEELIGRNVSVELNPITASFRDTSVWTWSLNAAASGVIKVDDDTNAITATAAGEARLYAKVLPKFTGEVGSTSKDYLRIKVTDKPNVKSIVLNNSSMNLKTGDTQQLTATVDPAGAPVTWETNNKAIATVDADGNVKAVSAGTAVIFAKAGSEVATCTVTVTGDVAATSIKLSKTEVTIPVGSSETILASTTPEGGVINWATSDATIAVVDNAGKITANKAGTATITATSGSASATVKVTVVDVAGGEPNTWGTNSNGKKIYFGENGQAITGWKKIGGYWYLFDYSTAEMKTGWAKDGGAWYYLQADGKMKTGWLKDGTKWYYLQGSGAMKTGWLKDAGKWYYLHPSNGDMQTGWVKDGGIWYYLNGGNGDMKANEWLLESGVWYYLQGSGAMCANGTYQIDGRNSKFASSGRWLGYV